MNKISMDALNAGWTIGLGTSVAPRQDDFALLAASKADEQQPEGPAPVAPLTVANPVARMLDQVAAVFALIALRQA